MPSSYSILVLNPGSTSTKLALTHNEKIVRRETIPHSPSELVNSSSVWDQYLYRLNICEQWVSNNVNESSAVVAIGGLLRPVQGGVYRINETMLRDARNNVQGEHASNLGCALANAIAGKFNVDAFVVDPVSVDEFEPLAFYSGHPCIKRRSLSHALNIHAAARRGAHDLGRTLSTTSLIVAHIGGGISVAPVRGGNIIDVNDAASDGPFSPERTGGLPLQEFISLCFSQKYSETELRNMVMGKGGLVAYLGTNSVQEVEQRIKNGDTNASEIYRAMAYQIAKEIGAMSTVLNGSVDAILLTGGAAYSTLLTDWITERVCFIAPVIVYPGEDEMQSLADGALRVLRGEEQPKEY